MKLNTPHKKASETSSELQRLTEALLKDESLIREGDAKGKERQKRLNRLTARERINQLVDVPQELLELGLFAAHGMYSEWGALPAAGVITAIGRVSGRSCMIIANDATVKAGAMFPQSVKKVLRAQRIAFECRLPILYLVDSSGVFLPLQEDIFPDEDDFGRIFRNNSILSAAGIPQYAAVMGNCIAGGAYLPVLCDKLLMTEGSGLYLAGPALVKAAIGQQVDTEELGGARMHHETSGTADFYAKDDKSCLEQLKKLVALLPEDPPLPNERATAAFTGSLFELLPKTLKTPYDTRILINALIDKDSFLEYKADYGRSLITAYVKIAGQPAGLIANQRLHTHSDQSGTELGGVIYSESADKAARFVMDCNQSKLPLIFLQDVLGFMVGKEAEQGGIIRSGAKLVNAVSNSVVPKITVVVGNSFGAGNYALCGKAYDPNFIVAWPNAKYAVMGASQAAGTLIEINQKAAERQGKPLDQEGLDALTKEVRARYEAQTDIRYGAARGWVDALIDPNHTRSILAEMLYLTKRAPLEERRRFHTGVLQV